MPSLSGISYEEMEGSGRLRYSPDGISGERVFIVDWADRIEFAKALLGYTHAVGHSPIRRDAERFPGYDYLYCQRATSAGVGEVSAATEMISYTKAKITAEYAPLAFGSSVSEGDDYDAEAEGALVHLEETWDFGTELVSAPPGKFRYEGVSTTTDSGGHDESLVEQPLGKMVGGVELSLSSKWEPELYSRLDDIKGCLGKVNNAAFYGFNAGRVLFVGASARRVITPAGGAAWTITYRFRARMQSWNSVYRGDTSGGHDDGWWEVTPHPYEETDFTVLFQ